QAQAIVSLFPIQVTKWIQQVTADAWKQIKAAYTASGVWVTAAIKWWEKADTWYVRALKAAWMVLRKKLLNMLVDDIVKWIKGGGKPRLVTDWQGFLRKAADDAAGQFVDKYLGMGFLCRRFDVRLKFALARVPTFDQAATCTLSQVVGNFNAFLNDFSSGGWKGWISLSEPQNNIYGAYLLAQDELTKKTAAAAEAAKNEAIASSGFLDDKRCTNIYEQSDPSNTGDFRSSPIKREDIPTGWVCSEWTTYTPGKIAAEAVAKAANIDIDWLISAKEFEEYLGAILDAVINRMIREGVTYMTAPSGGSEGQTGAGISTGATAADADIYLSPYQDALQNSELAPALIDQLGLLQNNYSGYLGQLQNNLSVLTQISNTQSSIVDVLQQITSLGCPLPTGVTRTILSTQTIGNCATTCPCADTTTQTTRFTIAGVGEITRQRTTAITQVEETYSSDVCQVWPSGLSPYPCSIPVTCSSNITSTIISSTMTDSSEITAVNDEIAYVQNKINQITTAISDIQNYQQAADFFMETYDAYLNGTGSQQEAYDAEDAMYAAKDRAITSIQTVTGSSSTDFQMLLQEIQNASLQVVQENNDAQMTRGIISDCSYVQPATYYGDLCSAQRILTDMQSALTACQTITSGP
ncbi:hypothetical protein KJ853_03245, partial [Patescibacteria group bacterium]|nr:hypothetical protein [Patescibacteria group bacterium]